MFKKILSNKKYFYVLTLFSLLIVYLTLLTINPNGLQKELFFLNCKCFMGDFFEVLQATSSDNPYFYKIGGSYLPFSYVVLMPFTKIVNYTNTNLQMCWSNPHALMSALFFSFSSGIVFIISLFCLCKEKKYSYLLILLPLISGTFWRTLERGNLILLTVSFVNIFLAYYNNKSNILKTIALCSLSIASVFKIFPCIFALLLFREKKWKEVIIYTILTIALIIIPFFFLKNSLTCNFSQLLKNLNKYSAMFNNFSVPKIGIGYGVLHILSSIGCLIKTSVTIDDYAVFYSIAHFFNNLMKLIILICFCISLFTKNNYRSLLLLCMSVIFFPISSETYCSLYFIPLIFQYLAEHENTKQFFFEDIAYILLLSPLQFRFFEFDNYQAINLGIIILLFTHLFKELKEYNKNKTFELLENDENISK